MSEEHVDTYIIVILPVMGFLAVITLSLAIYLTFFWRKDKSKDIEKHENHSKVSSNKASTDDEQAKTVHNKEEETSDNEKKSSNIEDTHVDHDNTVDNKEEDTSDNENTSSNVEDAVEEKEDETLNEMSNIEGEGQNTVTTMTADERATKNENTSATKVCPPVNLDKNKKEDDIESQTEKIEVQYECQKCGLKNSLRTEIENHILTVHKKKRVKSATSSVIDETTSTHDRKKKCNKFTGCSLCGKRFKTDDEFILHTKVAHVYSGVLNVKKENSEFIRTQSNKEDGCKRLRKIQIPSDVYEKFVELSKSNSQKGMETEGILAGQMKENEFRVTHLLILPESRNIDYGDLAVQQKHNLLLLGWIGTQNTFSPSYTSVDLHKQHYFQNQLAEAIGTIYSISSSTYSSLSLTEQGVMEIKKCIMDPTIFHHHTQKPPLYKSPTHMYNSTAVKVSVIDMRNK